MTVHDLTATLAIPIEIEFRNDEGAFIVNMQSNQCPLKNFGVIRWWPEDKGKIVVFVALPDKSK